MQSVTGKMLSNLHTSQLSNSKQRGRFLGASGYFTVSYILRLCAHHV